MASSSRENIIARDIIDVTRLVNPPLMITEENLDSDSREVHYVRYDSHHEVLKLNFVFISENGRVEGLILNKTPIDDIKRTRPRSAKAGRRTASRDGRASVNTIRTFDIETINEKGVQELFSDILYDSDEALEEYKDDFEDVDDDNNWSDDSPLPYSLSASSLTSRSDNYPYQQR